jgi:hypothetical protein
LNAAPPAFAEAAAGMQAMNALPIHDPVALDRAMAYRVNAGLGDIVFGGPTLGSPLDPSTPPEKANMTKYGSQALSSHSPQQGATVASQ